MFPACRRRLSSRRIRRSSSRSSSDSLVEPHRYGVGPRRWSLMAPTVLWSVVILVIAPSFYGFGVVPPSDRSGMATTRAAAGSSAYSVVGRASRSRAVASAETIPDGSFLSRRREGSTLGAMAWLKDRVRDGKRRILPEMMSAASETQVDAARFEKAPVPAEEREFAINGWRWHTRVVLRDTARFRRVLLLAAEAEEGGAGHEREREAVERVVKCYKFFWSFSVAKLHNTEQTLFFPWLRDLLPKEVLPYLEEFDREREAVIRVGNKMGQLVEEARRASSEKASSRAFLLRCAHLTEDLEGRVSRLSRAQEGVIVPFTAAYVTGKTQWKFNEKVILNLGLVNAQVFLVAMHDAVKPDKEEFKVFRSQVPKFARALIPTWRRVLYSPRASCLE